MTGRFLDDRALGSQALHLIPNLQPIVKQEDPDQFQYETKSKSGRNLSVLVRNEFK